MNRPLDRNRPVLRSAKRIRTAAARLPIVGCELGCLQLLKYNSPWPQYGGHIPGKDSGNAYGVTWQNILHNQRLPLETGRFYERNPESLISSTATQHQFAEHERGLNYPDRIPGQGTERILSTPIAGYGGYVPGVYAQNRYSRTWREVIRPYFNPQDNPAHTLGAARDSTASGSRPLRGL
eukprot:CAMPEP_0113706436 /NCGR_PEP_ID=MMETSP0038_2-20120614/27719_1 /TAXON_ID=2898 /ORGANISM="Cryptomonas paramecium" /LENGTH=179 /DNA_ID=CAMNT_0000631619 /DNA_START=70 /DNA_END=607 /DNA_ORIENTATION=- /assembly_acc=CAM_ASM_000170